MRERRKMRGDSRCRSGSRQAEAQLSAAQAEATRASDDAVRYRALHAKDEVSASSWTGGKPGPVGYRDSKAARQNAEGAKARWRKLVRL